MVTLQSGTATGFLASLRSYATMPISVGRTMTIFVAAPSSANAGVALKMSPSMFVRASPAAKDIVPLTKLRREMSFCFCMFAHCCASYLETSKAVPDKGIYGLTSVFPSPRQVVSTRPSSANHSGASRAIK